MNLIRLTCCAMLAALLAAACATAPDERAQSPGGSDVQDAAQAATPAEIETITLGAAELDPGHVVTCRDELKMGSNVIVTRCMTAENWKHYKRFQTRQAQEMLRVLQGSAYR